MVAPRMLPECEGECCKGEMPSLPNKLIIISRLKHGLAVNRDSRGRNNYDFMVIS